LKAIFASFGECGLRELLASLGFVTQGQYNYIAECHDVRRSHALLMEVGLAIESQLLRLFLRDNPSLEAIFFDYPEADNNFLAISGNLFDFFELWKENEAHKNPR